MNSCFIVQKHLGHGLVLAVNKGFIMRHWFPYCPNVFPRICAKTQTCKKAFPVGIYEFHFPVSLIPYQLESCQGHFVKKKTGLDVSSCVHFFVILPS